MQRYALVNSAHNVVKYKATFMAYYDDKSVKDQSQYTALGHCAGIQIRDIWKILGGDVEFNFD